MHRISYILYNYEDKFRPEDFYIIGSNRILLNYITSVLPDLDVYGVSQMTMEQLFIRLLYEDWDSGIYRVVPIDKKNKSLYIKGSYEWFHDLEQFCREYENRAIPEREVRLEKSGALLLGEEVIRNYLDNNPQLSMQSKINMLNEMLFSKLENELSGKYVSYTPEEKKELQRMCRWHFGKDVWKGSVFEVYREFLQMQEEEGKGISFTENIFDVYDLAALAYLYKRIKETDGIREASHVIIDEAQDFGMMAYGALAYCLRGCTYTIMGDVSQNIHFGYGLNDWRELQKLILTGDYDSFGLLKKSYRNTVEISDFATEILRHGNFPVYPVEPINRHGNKVVVTECRDKEAMIQEMVKSIESWQRAGHETIAVICRDEEETAMVSGCLREKISLVDSDLETAEFGNGVMVLPVEYTKGLEFDAVLIYHPSVENYPAEDSCVKLLYVAATRALHDLSVIHQGDLTDLIAKPVSEEKRMQSLENEVYKQARFYTKKEITTREQELLDVIQGDKERAMRGYIGPKPIVVQQGEKKGNIQKAVISQKKETTALMNKSPYQFGDVPDNSRLRPDGHGRIDNSVRMVRKTKRYIDLISNYGILRLTPLEERIIRVQFQKGRMAEFDSGHWNYKPEQQVSWTAKESKSFVEVVTEGIAVRIDKKTGAVLFFSREGKLLLAEKAALPRQMEGMDDFQTWIYFDWPKKEKLFAKGVLADDLERMNQKARYISFGGKKLRMPLLISEYGYGIGVAAKGTVMCCAIPMYGPYLYAERVRQMDYYFLYGGNKDTTLELYKKLQK